MGSVPGRRRNRNYLTGEDHPRWLGGERQKPCQHCGKVMVHRPPATFTHFKERKFCSMGCAKHGQRRFYGEDHPLYKPDSRRKQRRGQQGSWAQAVISRDKATCRQCGARGVPLHAHHIKSFAEHPELRFEVSNGLTLCYECHWNLHAALTANAVNSGNTLPGQAGGNPEPSFGRKPVEGVTTSGRAYRRWEGECGWCGKFISRQWSDAKGKKNLFCDRHCAGKHLAAHKTPEQRRKQAESLKRTLALESSMAVIAATSAARESDDIV